MQRLRTVTLLDVSAVAGHHAMPAALLFPLAKSNMNPRGFKMISYDLLISKNGQTYLDVYVLYASGTTCNT